MALEQQVECLSELGTATQHVSNLDFEGEGVALASEMQMFGIAFVILTDGMLSPDSCICFASPGTEGTLFVEVIEKWRSRKRVKIEQV
jgi:hypothetical protein